MKDKREVSLIPGRMVSPGYPSLVALESWISITCGPPGYPKPLPGMSRPEFWPHTEVFGHLCPPCKGGVPQIHVGFVLFGMGQLWRAMGKGSGASVLGEWELPWAGAGSWQWGKVRETLSME